KALRAGQALPVHAQPDLANIPLKEGGKEMVQQSQSQAAFAPGTQHRKLVDPARPVIAYPAERHAHYLLAFLGQKPERRVNRFVEHVSLPVLEAARGVPPVVLETLLNGFIGAIYVLRAAIAGAHVDAFRPLRG